MFGIVVGCSVAVAAVILMQILWKSFHKHCRSEGMVPNRLACAAASPPVGESPSWRIAIGPHHFYQGESDKCKVDVEAFLVQQRIQAARGGRRATPPPRYDAKRKLFVCAVCNSRFGHRDESIVEVHTLYCVDDILLASGVRVVDQVDAEHRGWWVDQ